MRVLITAGPTREPIDAVRYIGNRSSGQVGAALADAARKSGHDVTLISGPVTTPMPAMLRRIDVETAAQMHAAVLDEFKSHDLLIMAAAVADYRPKKVHVGKIVREGDLTIECEPTTDIVAAAGHAKRPNQRIIGFSLEAEFDVQRSLRKMADKHLDLIVYNSVATIDSQSIDALLIWPDGRQERLGSRPKSDFADILLARAADLFMH